MRELAFLNSGVSISIFDERTSDRETFHYGGGITEYVKYLNTGVEPVHPDVIAVSRKDTENMVDVDVGIQYTTAYSEQVFSYVNSVNTREGGTHLEGFRSAITRAINNSARKNNLLKDNSLPYGARMCVRA